MPILFISYAREDSKFCKKIEKALDKNGITVWRDQQSIYGGQQWPKAIGEAISYSDFFILVWSRHSDASHFVEFEWNTAIALKKNIIPCLLDETDLPASLRAINGIFFDNFEKALSKLFHSLESGVQEKDSERSSEVIKKLAAVSETEPARVVAAIKSIFSNEGWSVKGNIYQAAGDIHVTVNVYGPSDLETIEEYIDAALRNGLTQKVQEQVDEQAQNPKYPLKEMAERVGPARVETARAIQHEIHTRGIPRINKAPEDSYSDNDWVIFVPSFMASELEDASQGEGTRIWMDLPNIGLGHLVDLELAPFEGLAERDASTYIKIVPTGLVKGFYDELVVAITLRGFNFRSFPFDWRKNLDEAARDLKAMLRRRTSASSKPSVSLVAHGAGSLVARRAIQMMGTEDTRAIIKNLILLAPIGCGTFQAVELLEGTSRMLRQLGFIDLRHTIAELQSIFATMSSVYQLLPWSLEALKNNPLDRPESWPVPIDKRRLRSFFGWSELIDTSFLNDRTTVIVGYGKPTVAQRERSREDPISLMTLQGDGIATLSSALVPGTATYYTQHEHSEIPLSVEVIEAITDVLEHRPIKLPTSPSPIR